MTYRYARRDLKLSLGVLAWMGFSFLFGSHTVHVFWSGIGIALLVCWLRKAFPLQLK